MHDKQCDGKDCRECEESKLIMRGGKEATFAKGGEGDRLVGCNPNIIVGNEPRPGRGTGDIEPVKDVYIQDKRKRITPFQSSCRHGKAYTDPDADIQFTGEDGSPIAFEVHPELHEIWLVDSEDLGARKGENH